MVREWSGEKQMTRHSPLAAWQRNSSPSPPFSPSSSGGGGADALAGRAGKSLGKT